MSHKQTYKRSLIVISLLLTISPLFLALGIKQGLQVNKSLAASVYPPDQTGFSSVTIQRIPMPGYLQTVTDPTFGNFVTRISDQKAFNTTDKYLGHEYAKIQAWNADGSMIFINNGITAWNTGYLLDGKTGKYLRTVHPGALAGHTPRWSNVNPNNMYGIPSTTVDGGACNNTNRLVVWHPITDTSSSPALTVLHTFTQFDSYADTSKCANMTFGLEEGNFSNDDSLGAVIGWSSTKNSWGIVTFNMTNSNTDTPTVTEIATDWLGSAGGTSNNPDSANWNNISAMPNSDGIVIEWNGTGSGINQGIEWLSNDLTIQKHVTDNNDHYDEALDANGNEMLVMSCSEPGSASTNLCKGVSQTGGSPFLAAYYLNNTGPTGKTINLYPQGYPNLAQSVHISCRNQFKRPGWCYLSDMENNPSTPIGYEQIYAIKLDSTKTIEVFGADHGSYNNCSSCNNYAALGVPSRDGTQVLFTSDWGAGTSSPDYEYLTQWPQPTNSPTPSISIVPSVTLVPSTTISPTASPTVTLTPAPTITSTPMPLTISNLSVKDSTNAKYWSLEKNIQSVNKLYGDKSYTIASLDQNLAGSAWIRTANNSKSYTKDPVVTFSINRQATVYVGFDNRSNKPSWVDSSWVNSGLQMKDSEPITFTFYKKTFAVGTVSLGHNATQTSGVDMYAVIVK